MEKINVDIVCPWWRRPEIVSIHARNMVKFIKNSPDWVEISYNCVISDEDPTRRTLKEIAWNHNFTVLSYKNQPLSCKINAGINWVLENKQPEYIMNMGSDDLCSVEIWDIYKPYIEKKTPIFGIDSCFVLDPETKQAHYLDLYNDTWPVGVLRMIRADLIRQLYEFNKLDLYPYGVDQGLDTASMRRLMEFGIVPEVIHTEGRPLTVGVKSNININHITHLNTLQCAKEVDFSTIKHLLK